MDFFHSEVASHLVFILGIFNIVLGTLLFTSCRCVPGMKVASRLMHYHWYTRFFKIHCYIWWVFWVSVIVHAVIAIGFFGVPF